MMEERLEAACAAIQIGFNAEVKEFRDEYTLFLNSEYNVEALRILRDQFEFEMLLDITAVDYWPQENPRFHLLYRLYSISKHIRILIRIPLDGIAPSIRSVEEVYPNANWYQREVYDLIGIRFEGHSDPRRIVMPEDWQGHPLRKDYPLGYEEVQFTFNLNEIQSHKARPKK